MIREKIKGFFKSFKSVNFREVMQNRKLLTAIGAAIVVLAFLVWLVIHFSVSGNKKSAPLDAIPSDAAMVLEIRQPTQLWSELSVTSGVWRELMNFEMFAGINKEIYFLDSLFKTNECATAVITDHPVYISFHAMENGATGFLYLTGLTNSCSNDIAVTLVKQAATSKAVLSNRSFNGEDITEVTVPGKKENFYFTVSKNVFICSFQLPLVEAAINQQKSGTSIASDAGFTKVSGTAGKKVDANLYINFNYFPKLISVLASSPYSKRIAELAGFADWSAIDISVKKDAILFNGFTSVNDTASNFLGLFANQEPHEMTMLKLIPSSTASFVYFGFSDFDAWYKAYNQYLVKKGKSAEHNSNIAKLNKEYKTDIEKNFLTWIGKEVALVITEPSDSDITSNMFAVVKADNISNALTLLASQSELQTEKAEKPKKATKVVKGKNSKKNSKTQTKEKTKSSSKPVQESKSAVTEIKTNKIYEFKVPGMFAAVFGNLFAGVEGKYYAVVDDYVIFANSSKALVSFLKDYNDEKTLGDNNNYLAFSKNISSESNVYLYCNIRKSLGIFLNYGNKDIYNYIASNFGSFKNFEAFAYQLKTNGKLFYNNICLKTNTTVVEESSALWTFKLDSTVFSKPQIVTDKSGKTKKIIAFDNAANFYIIDKDGSLIQKIPLKEKPLSDVFVIDYFKNGKSQFVFNTPSYIYIIDAEGKNVDNFPLRLTDASTGPMTVADFANDKEYRFIVPCGSKIYNYTKKGTVNPGWTIFKTKSDLYKEITALKFDGTDMLVTSDKEGNIYILDRKGLEKIKIKTSVTGSAFAKFYVSKNEKASSILTTDNTGNLIFISTKGDIAKKTISTFSASHYFLYEDFNNDKTKEYIFVDNNKVNVYDTALKLLFSYTIPSDISAAPVFYKDSGGKGSLGFVSMKANKIYLLKADCSLSDGFPLNGTTPFAISSLNNDGAYNLIVGSESTIYNYSFE
jgi:hypothetical protein